MRFLTTLSGNESNRDVFGVLRGRCSACDKCERFAPDVSQGQGWNSVKQLECATCHCSHTTHVQHKDETEVRWDRRRRHLSDCASQVNALDETTGVARTFSERAVLRCADSLADFMRGYLSLHGLQEEAWRLLPLLFWLEASIYTLDEANEESIADPKARAEERESFCSDSGCRRRRSVTRARCGRAFGPSCSARDCWRPASRQSWPREPDTGASNEPCAAECSS
jgi:hypothetical protein